MRIPGIELLYQGPLFRSVQGAAKVGFKWTCVGSLGFIGFRGLGFRVHLCSIAFFVVFANFPTLAP